MTHLFLVRAAAELSLKSKSVRTEFHRNLRNNLTDGLKRAQIEFEIKQLHHYFFLRTNNQLETEKLLKRTFGIGTYSYVIKTLSPQYETLLSEGEKCFAPLVKDKSFAVRCKKSGTYNFRSLDLERELGSLLNRSAKKVDLSHPEVTAHIDFIKDQSYLYLNRDKGSGGFPTGSQGRALCLLSGGFDSAVAAWRILKRGVKVDYLLCNIGGKNQERQVLQIAKILFDNWSYGYTPHLYIIDFKNVVQNIKENVSNSYNQVILKRMMYKSGEYFAKKIKASAIITGEALGQVSSQTLGNLNAINNSSSKVILRPLIGMDKVEIIDQAHHIGTSVISEKVKELCSISKGRPVTKAKLSELQKQEELLDFEILNQSLESSKKIDLSTVKASDLREPYIFKDYIPKNSTIIDCQNGRMFEIWHLPNAKHYDTDQLIKNFKQLDPNKEYFLYCTHGQQTPLIAELMQDQGFEAYAFKGGVKELKKLKIL